MAQYKVPQDVEADDKLLGPFSFRQFVYLLVAGGLIALAVGLFNYSDTTDTAFCGVGTTFEKRPADGNLSSSDSVVLFKTTH